MATTTSCPREVHIGDKGTLLEVTLYDCTEVVPLQDASVKEIILLKPSGNKVTKTASFKTDGSDGIIQYISLATDFDEVGVWKLQGHVVLPTGEWRSDVGKFKVIDNL